MSDKAFLKLLSGYENVTGEGIRGKRFFCRKISGSVTRVNKTRFSRVVFGGAARLGDRLAYSSTRAYGMFFLGFGLLSMLVTLARDYLGYYESLPISVLVVGAVFALIGIPFVLVDEPICLAFQRFVVTDYIFFEFFCLKRMSEDDEQKGIAPPLGLVLGILLALLGIVIPMGYVALGIAQNMHHAGAAQDVALVYALAVFIGGGYGDAAAVADVAGNDGAFGLAVARVARAGYPPAAIGGYGIHAVYACHHQQADGDQGQKTEAKSLLFHLQ